MNSDNYNYNFTNGDNITNNDNITYDDNYIKTSELKKVKEFVDICLNGTLINPNEIFYKSDNPKISIVIAVYNGEGYLNIAMTSIQNQDFKDIEIIMVDDYSSDNSVNLIKELMKKDPRIILLQNNKTKGTLYTKTKGILHSKGEYVMTLDEDDLYGQKEAFSILYKKAKKYNLDILGFSAINGDLPITDKKNIIGFKQTPILFQPNISEIMVYHDSEGKAKVKVGLLWHYIFKTSFFKKIINEIDEKFFNRPMILYDDCLLMYLLTKSAYNYMHIKRVFYFQYQYKPLTDKQHFRTREKEKNRKNLRCLSILNFLELIFLKTANTVYEKQYASFILFEYEPQCKYNQFIREDLIKLYNQFLDNEYIENHVKEKIRHYLSIINRH